MPLQSGKGLLVAAKVEATFNTAPGASGATVIRLTGGGLRLMKEAIQSNEIRSDGQTAISRHGSRRVEGSYAGELSLGGFDMLLEAVMRATINTSISATATGAGAFIDLTVNATNQMTRTGAGSFITDGFRAGDVIRLTNYVQAADNNINLRIKTVTATVITVYGTPLVTGAADTACTITRLKKLTRPATPVKRTFYIDQYNQDLDLSEAFGGCRFISMKIVGSPNGMATVEFGVLGASVTPLASGASPYYTTPTMPTGQPLVFTDSLIALGVPGAGADIAIGTAFELNLVIAAKTEPVIGSSFTPDVFDNDARLSGSISLIRQDLTYLTGFSAETEYDLHILLTEPESEPKDYIALYVPRLKLMGLETAIGGDGAMIETLPWTAGMKEGVAGYDDTMLTISTSSP